MSTIEGRKKIAKYKKEGYKYIGGEHNECAPQHWNQWCNVVRDDFHNKISIYDTPSHKEYCECGEKILYNCWIWNPETNRRRVIGSNCINKFTEGRTCADCGVKHKNRISNHCKDCRKNHCSVCFKKIDGDRYTKCYSCKFGRC